MDELSRFQNRVGLLVSVRDAAEAELALAGGADVIDVKEPNRGSLGAAECRRRCLGRRSGRWSCTDQCCGRRTRRLAAERFPIICCRIRSGRIVYQVRTRRLLCNLRLASALATVLANRVWALRVRLQSCTPTGLLPQHPPPMKFFPKPDSSVAKPCSWTLGTNQAAIYLTIGQPRKWPTSVARSAVLACTWCWQARCRSPLCPWPYAAGRPLSPSGAPHAKATAATEFPCGEFKHCEPLSKQRLTRRVAGRCMSLRFNLTYDMRRQGD